MSILTFGDTMTGQLTVGIDDGLTNGNLDVADVMFLIATALAVLSGLAYATGNVGTVGADPNAGRPYARFHAWAAALLAFAVGAAAFAWFLL